MTTRTPTPTEFLLAYEFAALMRNTLSAENMDAVNRRNAAADHVNACASHDFCDSNEVMLLALSNIGEEFDAADGRQAALTDAAWGVAKRLQFDVQSIGAEARAEYPGWQDDPAAMPVHLLEDAERAEQKAGLMYEHLDQANVGADHTASDLIDANRCAGPVESLLIVPLIERARILQRDIAALRDAAGAKP